MNLDARKLELMYWLLQINDESKLEKIIALKAILDKDIVAHTVDGYPIDRKDYINRVKEADERISLGRYIPIEDLEKEMEGW